MAVEQGVHDQGGNGYNESEFGRHEGFGNTAGELLGITGSKDGDKLEGVDHPTVVLRGRQNFVSRLEVQPVLADLEPFAGIARDGNLFRRGP